MQPTDGITMQAGLLDDDYSRIVQHLGMTQPDIPAYKLDDVFEAFVGYSRGRENSITIREKERARGFRKMEEYLRSTVVVMWQSGELPVCCGRLGMRHRTRAIVDSAGVSRSAKNRMTV